MTDELTRRETLKKATAVSGGLVLGVGAMGTAAAERNAGYAFAPLGSAVDVGDTFTIEDDADLTVELSPSCKSGPPAQEYQVFYVSGTLESDEIAVNPNRGVTPDSTVYEVTSVRDECEPAFDSGTLFAYRPA